MKISTRGRYGLLAMIDIAYHQKSGCVNLKSVASRQGLSEHYLEQLIHPLKKAGFVKSIRGAQGGYLLGRKPEDISAGDILRILEGSLSPVECLDGNKTSCGSLNCSTCVTRPLWEKMLDSVSSILDNTMLDKLVLDYENSQKALS